MFSDTYIQLPITTNGEIDVVTILDFMDGIVAEPLNKLECYLNTCIDEPELSDGEIEALISIEDVGICWKQYKMGELFERIPVNKLPYKAKNLPTDSSVENPLPCLTSSFRNQGLQCYCPRERATVLKNVISLPSNSDVYRAYFQSNEFTVLSDAYAIKRCGCEKDFSPNQYLFAISCINKVTDLPIYSYKNKLGGWNVVKDKYIFLPEKEGEIDLLFMENLVSALRKVYLKAVFEYVKKKRESIDSTL